MNVAVMLASGRERGDGAVVDGLCRAAVARRHPVTLFLLGDGVLHLDLGVRLAAAGVKVSLCEADAAMRGIHKSDQKGVLFGSLYDWARLAEDADRVVSFA